MASLVNHLEFRSDQSKLFTMPSWLRSPVIVEVELMVILPEPVEPSEKVAVRLKT